MPTMGQEFLLFLLIRTSPTFWATRILILRSYYFSVAFWITYFQISRFLDLGTSSWLWLAALGGGTSRRHSRTTEFRRSKELGQYCENPISASPVWGTLVHLDLSNVDCTIDVNSQ